MEVHQQQVLPLRRLRVSIPLHRDRPLLRPDGELNAILAAAIRAAIAETAISVVAFVVMGNHWHFVLRIAEDPTSLSSFMQKLKSTVALAVNEVTREKKVVWTWASERPGVHHVQILETNGKPLEGAPLR